jgi:hypothetical protein
MIGEQADGTFRIENLRVDSVQKKRLSISQVNTLSTCGEQYRRRYVNKERTPPGLAMLVGGVVDRIVTRNLQAKIESGMLLSLQEIKDLTAQDFQKTLDETEEISFKESEILDGEDESIAEARAKAMRLSILHATEVAPKLNPIYVQRSLAVELPGYSFDIGGVLDIQEFDSVRDTKAKGKTPSKDFAHDDDQLTVYALLVMLNDGAIPPRLTMDCLIDTKIPKYVPFETTRVEEDFNALLARIDAACYAIDRGAFIPAKASDWCCSRDYCGYFSTCKYVKHSRRPAA